MKDEQRVYIKGNLKRGEEVIKILIDLGGCNSHSMNGKNVNAYYFINPDGIIVNTYSSSGEVFSYVKEFYTKIELSRWKPKHGGRYFYINTIGEILIDVWSDMETDRLRYNFGNCFETFEEAKEASSKIKEVLGTHK